MNKIQQTTLWAASLTCVFLLTLGCNKPAAQLDPQWTLPTAVASSISGVGGWVDLYRCQDTIIGVNILRDGSAQGLFLNRDGKSWSELSLKDVPHGYSWYAAIDPQSKRILLPQGYAENEQLVMKALMGTINGDVGLREMVEKEWITDKKTLLGETNPKVKLNYAGKGRQSVGLGPGILNGPEVCIPYCLDAAEVIQQGKSVTIKGNGPFANGVFYSSDSGKTWEMEKVSDMNSGAPSTCKTKGCFYYFASLSVYTNDFSLWFSRKQVGGGKWEKPQSVTASFAMVYGRFSVAGEGDTAHICWMDRRHNKWRFNVDGPNIENNEIFYRRRTDADREWSGEVLLSKGLLYAYAPVISAEGDNVVVVWAGIRDADKQHTYMKPNDIYFVTSKDGGKTWTEPLKVTDGAKDGLTAGMPQVVLLNGTVHLLYTQGKSAGAAERSPGLTKLGGEPWPIYYTQRPFPN